MRFTLRGLAPPTVLVFLAGSACMAAAQDEYVLGPGDVIAITVFDHPEFSMSSIQVRPDGKVSHPFLGPMRVAGLTPSVLADKMAWALSTELRDPIVSVNVLGFRENQVYVLGEVSAPGAYPADAPLEVAKAIALAAGFTAKADRREALLIPREGPPRPLYLADALGEKREEYALTAGDTLLIRPADTLVSILGEVNGPGRYDLLPGANTVLDGIIAAGGLTEDADHEKALLIKPGQEPKTIDLTGVLAYEVSAQELRLEGGDMLVLIRADNRVTVWGAVSSPGKYLLQPGNDRVFDLLALAGGLSDTANREEATLIRATGEILTVDLEAITEEHDREANLQLRGGDLLTIATQRNEVTVLGAVNSPGMVTILPGDRLTDLLALVGGAADNGDLSNVRIIRGRDTMLVVNAKPILEEYDMETNILMKAGDTVIIPSTKREVLLFGYVSRPGPYPIAEGDRLLDLLAHAGGFHGGEGASPRVALIRREGDGAHVFLVNMQQVMLGQAPEKNYVLQDGDVIFVPRSRAVNWRELVSQLFQMVTWVRIIER